MVVHDSLSLANAFELGCDGRRYLSAVPTRHALGFVSVVAGLVAGGSVTSTPGFGRGHFWDWL